MGNNSVPRIIWTYWEQGSTPPVLVQLCHKSWQIKNPDYEFRQLDGISLSRWSDISTKVPFWNELSVQKRSNLLRLDLLERHGGVWVDATLYCLAPLSHWLPVHSASGFAVLDLPRDKNRFFASFFIASHPGSSFIKRWHRRHRLFFKKRPRPMRWSRKSHLMKRWPLLWTRWGAPLLTTRFFTKRWGYPYFIFHFIATREILTDWRSSYLWMRRSKLTGHLMSSVSVGENQGNFFSGLLDRTDVTVVKCSNRRPTSEEVLDLMRKDLDGWGGGTQLGTV